MRVADCCFTLVGNVITGKKDLEINKLIYFFELMSSDFETFKYVNINNRRHFVQTDDVNSPYLILQ